MTNDDWYRSLFCHRMRAVLVALALLALSACSGGNHLLQERMAYWQTNLSQGVPIGSSKSDAMGWATSQNVQFQYVEEQHWLYAMVERVPESGIPFPCSHWNIILKVSFDDTGHAIKSDVGSIGTCL